MERIMQEDDAMKSDGGLLAGAERRLGDFLDMLRAFVELESPSHEDKAASDRCGQFLYERFGGLGFRMEKLPRETCGDHIFGELGSGGKGVLFVGHYDTVFPIGTVSSGMPFRTESGKVYGPGVLDMKGGIVMAYFAIKLLQGAGMLPGKTIGVFFNSDEESGSYSSSDAIVEKAREYEHVFVMEPGIEGKSTVKMHRAGRAIYEIAAKGVSAHSGSNPHMARSPIHELANQLSIVSGWDRDTDGVTYAPTWINGGIPGTCMVPETAVFSMDVRSRTTALCMEADAKVRGMKALTPGVELSINGGIDKPVMEGDPALFALAKEMGRPFGLDLEGVYVGGGSDGNFTSAAGVSTLDGLGMTGALLHNPGEFAFIDHIAPRTALVAKLLHIL